ncbi:MAG: hypothetical protein K2N05_03635 [Muribaculaceae bacterium]|nr:hypothetical protein [Muribaculaceae bacterium]
MKKLFSFALCSLALCSVNAQKTNVDAAKKLSGKIDKIEEARALINDAKENPETSKDPFTYFTAGKIEFDAFDSAKRKQALNPNDKDVNPLNMGQQLINGYNNMVLVMPLDQEPNEKGEIKPKYTKDALKQINGHFDDYWNGALAFYQEQKYYPEAYNAFLIYGSLPTSEYADKKVAATPDSLYNQALFNAGVCAYSGNSLKEAADAFKKARMQGTSNEQNYVYEIACWQNLASKDSTLAEASKNEINAIARAGYEKFGMDQPIFINNLVNSLVFDDKLDEAIDLINSQIQKTPEIASLYGLLGFTYDRKGDDDASVAAYKKAASLPGIDAENLKLVCKKLYRVGASLRENMNPADKAAKENIKNEYFLAAKDAALKAKELSPETTHDMDSWIENIDYALDQYFK